MAEEQKQDDSVCCCQCHPCIWLLIAVWIALIVTPAVITGTSNNDPVYSVSVTGVAGLDPAKATANLPLSPVFNLTIHIDNSREWLAEACIRRLSTVAVSYGDAVLGRGSVPEFCAKGRKVRERGTRAWGQHVDLPQFLRDQLAGELAAGEASVDVKVTTPAGSVLGGDTVLVCSQAKIGGGPATCAG